MERWLVFATVACLICMGCMAKRNGDKSTYELNERLRKAKTPGPHPPVRNVTDAVTIDFGVALIRIIDFDEDNWILTAHFWERYLWRDYRLEWEPSDYGGITAMRMHPGDVWRPDIVCYTALDDEPNTDAYNVVVHTSGEVLHIPRTVRRIGCHQLEDGETWKCNLKYGSWSFDGLQIGLDEYEGTPKADLSDYAPHPEYQIAEGEWSKGLEIKYYPCCEEPYPSVEFPIFIKVRGKGDNEQEIIQSLLRYDIP